MKPKHRALSSPADRTGLMEKRIEWSSAGKDETLKRIQIVVHQVDNLFHPMSLLSGNFHLSLVLISRQGCQFGSDVKQPLLGRFQDKIQFVTMF